MSAAISTKSIPAEFTANAPERNNMRWAVCFLLFLATTINYMDRSVFSFIEPQLHGVAFMGWNLLNGSDRPNTESPPDVGSSRVAQDAFYPLTLPLTVGPGSISVALTIGAHHASGTDKAHFVLVLCSALVGLLALALTIYMTYRFASRLVRWLGSSGVNVLVRLSAFILVCIGVQIAWGGLAELIAGLHEVSLPNVQGIARLAL